MVFWFQRNNKSPVIPDPDRESMETGFYSGFFVMLGMTIAASTPKQV